MLTLNTNITLRLKSNISHPTFLSHAWQSCISYSKLEHINILSLLARLRVNSIKFEASLKNSRTDFSRLWLRLRIFLAHVCTLTSGLMSVSQSFGANKLHFSILWEKVSYFPCKAIAAKWIDHVHADDYVTKIGNKHFSQHLCNFWVGWGCG